MFILQRYYKYFMILFAFIKHDMYFCPNKDNAVFIYKTNKSGIKFLNKT